MKLRLLNLAIIYFIFSIITLKAQAPNAIPYQAIARNNSGNPISNQLITIRFSIHDGNAGGTIAYQETQNKTTNSQGLFTANIGEGNIVSGSFTGIDWGNGSKFLQVEFDATGGNTFTDMGTQQMLSVPFALNAANGNFKKTGNNIYNSNSGSVGINTTTPAVSAQLEVNSTTKGFLPPRMSALQRDSIFNPIAGLVVYCNDCGGGELEVYNGIAWRNMLGGPSSSANLDIGSIYQGGIIVYILLPGDLSYNADTIHGLIVSPADHSSFVTWGCAGTNLPGANGIAFGTGNQNTIDIMNGCATADIAARVCGDLNQGGYSDWYLPGKDELHMLYMYLGIIGSGGFAGNYWSSTEVSSSSAWVENLNNGSQFQGSKGAGNKVRAVRTF